MADYTIFPLGDQAVTISLGNSLSSQVHEKVMAMKRWLQRNTFPGLLDIVVAYSSLTIAYDLYQLRRSLSTLSAFEFVRDLMTEAYRHSKNEKKEMRAVTRVPVCYEDPFSPDMDFICQQRKIEREKIISLHTSGTYQVYMIGFLPGFPYMARVDEAIVVPRKEKPRTKVDAGSVGIAGIQTGIYPVDSPGGWQIIGRTPLVLFNKDANPPVNLESGDQVEFYAISKKEFEHLTAHPS